jgi:hypothetical protein
MLASMVLTMMLECFVSAAYSDTVSVISLWGCQVHNRSQVIPFAYFEYNMVIIELREILKYKPQR